MFGGESDEVTVFNYLAFGTIHQLMSPFNESKFSFTEKQEDAEGRASESGDPVGVLFLGGERDEIRPDIVCREKVSWLN